jgi:hypothetical protein
MTAQKRGLGRGLEALLVDVNAPVRIRETVQPALAQLTDEHAAIATIALMKAIQKENANLIKEVKALKDLLDDFEALVRNLNVDQP